jgi:hypothetical protein
MSSPTSTAQIRRHASPPLGILAIAYTVLFCAGLYPVTMFGGMPYYPGPWEPIQTITAFFQARPNAVLLCTFLQFGSAIPLGIFTASAVSRLKFLGVKAAGADIALFGGFATAISMMIGSSLLSTMTRPNISHSPIAVEALYYVGYGIGGPGFSVPFGLLIAGLSVPVLFRRLTARWIPIAGLVIAACGELSWLNIMFPKALPLIPLTRFPGFLWLIALGFALPTTTTPASSREVRDDAVA